MRNIINKIIIVFLIIVLIALSGCSMIKSETYKEIDKLVKSYYEDGEFYGTILVARDDKILYQKGYGTIEAYKENVYNEKVGNAFKIENTSDTKFAIYSLTKAFTAVLTLQLVEEGKLNLDDKIVDVIPEVLSKNILEKGKDITIYHLLTNTSGIPDFSTMIYPKGREKDFSKEKIMELISHNKLLFEPNTQNSYSNTNFYILGLIIEKITGESYKNVLRKNICTPLEMINTGYYDGTEEININAWQLQFMKNMYSNGGMYSTVEDLYKWDQVLYTNKLLSKEYMEILFKPNLDNYACGWGTAINQDNNKVIFHNGSATPNVVETFIGRIPEDKVAIIILTNKGSIPGNLITELGMILYDIDSEEMK